MLKKYNKLKMHLKRIGGPDPKLSLEELERNMDIARARYLYALRQEKSWKSVAYSRESDFEEATIAYVRKKHKLSDEDLDGRWEQNHQGIYLG